MFDQIKKTEEGYRKACGRCGGSGYIAEFAHVFNGECYKCLGVGATGKAFETAEKLTAHLAKLELAREKREAKREAERLAKWEAGRAQREAEEAQREAERIAYEAELAQWKHLSAQLGESVTVEGVVTTAVTIDTQFGASRLIVVETAEREAVKLFTSAQWSWETERDQTVTISGLVKSFDEYQGKPQTVLNRPKRLS